MRIAQLVVLPVPTSVHGVWSRWVPLLKPVAAVAGDEVCVTGDALWIAGIAYGPVRAEAHGRVLPQIRGCGIVQPGTVFLASPAPDSLDGRYLGPTPIASLAARALPVFTWH